MRTTLNLDDELVMEAKIVAIRTRRTLSAVIEAGLRRELARVGAGGEFSEPAAMPVSSARGGPHPGVELRERSTGLSLPTWDGGGFPEGIDIDSNASLLDYIERQHQ